MKNWPLILLLVSAAGLVDAAYLLSDVFYPTISYICPSAGLLDCVRVTQTAFSRIFGIPVALLAVLWFASFVVLAAWRPSFQEYVLLPLWISGLLFVVYLVGVEAFLVHAICLYCTVAHSLALLMGIPIAKLTLGAP